MAGNTYCTNCGTPLDRNGMCPQCGAVYSSNDFESGATVTGYSEDIGGFTSVSSKSSTYTSTEKDYSQSTAYSTQPEEQYYGYDTDDDGDAQVEYYDSEGEEDEEAPAAVPVHRNHDVTASDFSEKAGEIFQTVKEVSSAVFGEWLDCARVFFAESPSAAADKVKEGVNYSWAVFAGLNALAAAFFTAGMVGNCFNALLSKVYVNFPFMMNMLEKYTFGKMCGLFFLSLIAYAALFFAASGCEYVFLSSVDKKKSFDDAFRIVAAAYFPLTLTCAAAFLLSFIFRPIAAVLVLCGVIESFVLLNDFTRRYVDDKAPYWGYMFNDAAQVVAATVIASIALAIAL